ncbi:NTF2 fold immunity protein [Pasteurella sp. PK-2025]|uniref:NTF2 fold immunity protein n=1 Tax=Pasteurella sp. PK-2025 TaxID=3413133 RepID=UPI003C76585F
MEKISLENLNLAEKTLLDFFKVINAWNINSYNLIQKEGFDEKVNAEITSSLTPIINQYCTPKLSESIAGHCSDIPGYDINFLSIDKYEIVTKNKICFFITETNRTETTYRYTMVYKDEKWLIDRKDWFDSFDNKWKKHYI